MALKNILFCLLLMLVLAGCKHSLDQKLLAGKWKYIRLEHPNASPPDSLTTLVLEQANPSIEFGVDGTLMIKWDGKVLSHGTYHIDGDNIRFKEQLEGGKTREFPFYVSKLTDKELIFETTGEDGSKVSAVKE